MFDNSNFLRDLDQKLSKGETYTGKGGKLFIFTNVFKLLPDKHAPFKTKKYEDNQGQFIIKESSKAIMNKSKMQNKYHKCPLEKTS